MKVYRVAGTFLMGNVRQPFTKEVAAINEGTAVERVYSVLGSNHRAKRRGISVERVEEIPVEAIEGGRDRAEEE